MAYSGLNWTQTTHVRLFEQVLDQSISHGHMRVVLPSGSELGQFGHPTAAKAVDAGERAVVLWIHDADMLSMVVCDSDIGLGDAYMRGMFDVAEIVVSRSAPADASMEGPSTEKLVADAGLVALLEIMTHNLGRATELLDAGPLAALVAGMPTLAAASALYCAGNAVNNMRHQLRSNTIGGSRENIEEHYDLGNDMYELFLDDTMSYSSGIHTTACEARRFGPADWDFDATPELPLKAGQLAKLDAVIARAGIQPGDSILEIGCGWGSFAIRAASTIPGIRLVGITISREQLALAQKRVTALGLDASIELCLCDYRLMGLGSKRVGADDELPVPTSLQLPGSFDRVVSIEMLEAVGHEHLPGYFEVVDRMLKPNTDASALIQVIGLPNSRYEAYMRGSDFIRRFIFPGGHLPCLDALAWATGDTSLELESVDDIGPDYAITLRMWRERFLSHRASLTESLGTRFVKMWEFYFAYCEVGFAQGAIHDWHLRYVKKAPAPPTDELPLPGLAEDRAKPRNKRLAWVAPFVVSLWMVAVASSAAHAGLHMLIMPIALAAAVAGFNTVGDGGHHKVHAFLWSGLALAWVALAAAEPAAVARGHGHDARETAHGFAVLAGAGLYLGELVVMLRSGVASWRALVLFFIQPWAWAVTFSGFGVGSLAMFMLGDIGSVAMDVRTIVRARGTSLASSPIPRFGYILTWVAAIAGSVFLRLVPHTIFAVSLATSPDFGWLAVFAAFAALIYDLSLLVDMSVKLRIDQREQASRAGTGRAVAELREAVVS
ncbi:cyclopropane-fatty-acyl-phospholipid synthase [Thecamonas trahens ATCC 50062]|uniref:Cyclopropane-fatty-acyl-phospholipid synthase n=1 Tax=Thecamonas trahens ATCC 50062 TaxID=461836 RepID=A0A0L0DPB5_THETB|nr:cyclopropane-fatty-acyl-phospholipid synthase [Thecamonas trahens ATCC 50062]KNC53268.1 cyclopropane-fatty-acyl-phospholipid synthase [Thecamonas trahens ATCC 50062]|eukprot:XP_013754532.1 cyclopropane-fatty-acyl-phospholipid synthase [Thecamonas trahens ATCC 50062]